MKTLLEILSDVSASWTRCQPASPKAIATLTAGCDFALPNKYLSFLSYSNGGEGFLDIEPGYFQLWHAEEILEHNQRYHVDECLPKVVAIGSSGGGEMLTIRKRSESHCPVYMIPFIVMDEREAIQIACDFETFAMALGRDEEHAGRRPMNFRANTPLE
jgi:SMI1 / KNR4 family (SUKH-1)